MGVGAGMWAIGGEGEETEAAEADGELEKRSIMQGVGTPGAADSREGGGEHIIACKTGAGGGCGVEGTKEMAGSCEDGGAEREPGACGRALLSEVDEGSESRQFGGKRGGAGLVRADERSQEIEVVGLDVVDRDGL